MNDYDSEGLLNDALDNYSNDLNTDVLVLVLRNLVLDKGTVTAFAKQSGISRQHLYKIFSNKSKPQFSTLVEMINALGFRLEAKSKCCKTQG